MAGLSPQIQSPLIVQGSRYRGGIACWNIGAARDPAGTRPVGGPDRGRRADVIGL
jgi:hypothetical protein